MSSFSTTLRPGLLVNVSTSIKGNVKYNKADFEEATDENGVLRASWETQKTVIDAAEHERASKVRNKARGLIGSVCSSTAFGFLCPESATDDLKAAIAAARTLCDDFNATASVTRVAFYAITGRVAPDDVEAVKAINSEVRQLLADMTAGVQKLEVKVIRDAADRAKQLGSMLSPEAQARITIAIEAARSTARKIVAAGEQAAVEIDRRTLTTLAEARTAFLDIDQPDREVAAPVSEGRAIDLAPEQGEDIKPVAPQSRALEIG